MAAKSIYIDEQKERQTGRQHPYTLEECSNAKKKKIYKRER